jgi:hypothetical protein
MAGSAFHAKRVYQINEDARDAAEAAGAVATDYVRIRMCGFHHFIALSYTRPSANSTTSTTTYRDSSGKTVGTASGTSPSRLTYRDASGKTTGTATVSGNTTTFRDSSGRTTGTASRSGDTITFRDASGRTTGTGTARK